jgi:hypothetical protein
MNIFPFGVRVSRQVFAKEAESEINGTRRSVRTLVREATKICTYILIRFEESHFVISAAWDGEKEGPRIPRITFVLSSKNRSLAAWGNKELGRRLLLDLTKLSKET